MGGGSGETHSAHGSSGKAATAYPDRFPNSCEFRIPGKIKNLLLFFFYFKIILSIFRLAFI
jgi:hypothetical protein